MTPEADIFVICAFGIAVAWALTAGAIVGYYVWKKVRDGGSD